jgi:multidrug efflux pump subunit AcrA (membrane-fusion protein)
MSGGDKVEIRQGLTAGDRVAVEGAFLLKSELLR